jgi:DNA polymerase-1
MNRPSIWGIDGDILLYAVGFASNEDTEEEAIRSFRHTLQRIMDGCECSQAQVFLTGPDNYRNSVPTYKANRTGTDKPVHFQALKHYVMTELDGITADNEEADDLLGIYAVRDGWGIATLDKDLDGVPGWHYNWNRDEVYHVGGHDADRFFYTQLLTGDRVDNIPGIFQRTGRKATAKVKAPLAEMTDPRDMYAHVLEVYMEAVKDKRMSSDEGDVTRWLAQQGHCLWIRREPQQLWSPPA